MMKKRIDSDLAVKEFLAAVEAKAASLGANGGNAMHQFTMGYLEGFFQTHASKALVKTMVERTKTIKESMDPGPGFALRS